MRLRAHVTEALTVNRHLPWRAPAAEGAAVTMTIQRNREDLRSRLIELLAEARPSRGDTP